MAAPRRWPAVVHSLPGLFSLLGLFLEVCPVTLREQFQTLPKLLKVSEVAEFTGTHERTVRRWIRDGRLVGLESPIGLRVSRRSLWRFLGLDLAMTA